VPARWTWIEAVCGALFGLLAYVVRDPWQIALLAPFAAVLVSLALIDLGHHRLPNAIVYPSFVVATIWIVVARILGGALDPVGAAIGSLAFGGTLLLIALVSRGGMGMGDVKLAGLIGLVVGAVDLPSVGVAAAAGILFGGVAGIAALARGADRRSALPFGPMLAAGALVAACFGPPLADAYLGLFS
jgi:leader peptidase (prepilin peptidase)/N-methyltransferase